MVANEVKTLDEQTARATEEIRGRMDALQSGMNDILAVMKESGSTVDAASQAVHSVGDLITAVNTAVDQVTEKMTTVASIVQEQMAATNEVNASINATAGISDHAIQMLRGLAVALDQVGKVVLPLLQEFGKARTNDVGSTGSFRPCFVQEAGDRHAGRGGETQAFRTSRSPCVSLRQVDDAIGNPDVKSSDAYRRINDPHQRVHAFGKETLAQYRAGNLTAAVAAAEKMDAASTEVFAALDHMARLF